MISVGIFNGYYPYTLAETIKRVTKDGFNCIQLDLSFKDLDLNDPHTLPQNLTVEIRGQQVAVDKAWRVTVQGGPFPVRALPAVIWIDDQIVGNGIENETLSQITAITFDSSLIREGGVVSISYGEDKESRRKFPQALQLKQGGGNQ